jgi:quercetin dioxygenase-like cupin family protein
MTDSMRRQGLPGYLLRAGEHVVDAETGVKVSRASSGGTLTVIESHARGGAPAHTHENEDEAMYVLDGSIAVECGDESWALEHGDFVFMPRGVRHAWDVVGDWARVLVIAAPGGLDEFLRELHAASSDERASVGAKYGIQ